MDTPGNFSVTAIMAAYNEEDIIGLSIQHLIEQGVSVYLVDRASTDATVAEAQRFVGKGLVGIERFPAEPDLPGGDSAHASWGRLLERKQKLAQELSGDWFIHQGADEFRESPWPHLDLCQAIRRVHQAGYNAIDFAAFAFPPTDDSYRKGDDLRATFRYCEPAQRLDRLRIDAWKRSPADLLASGGHEACFPERRVFPIRFLLRLYPIRNRTQGERRILQESQPGWDPTEGSIDWHAQRDGVESGHRFIRDIATLTAYDPDALRLQLLLRHRGVEELETALAVSEHDLDLAQREAAIRAEELERLRREQVGVKRESEQAQQDRDALAGTLAEFEGQRAAQTRALEAAKWERDELDRTLDEVEGERDGLARALEAAERERDALARGLGELQAQRDSLARTVEEIQAQRDSLARTVEETQGQRDSLTRTLEGAQAERDSLTRTNSELAANLARLQARVDELLSSWSWRATGPAREVLRRLRGL